MSEPAQAQDTSAESPWPLSTYSGKLKAHIEAAPPTWVEGQLVEFNLRNGNAWMTLRDLEQEVSFSTVAWRTVAGSLNGTVQPGSRVVALVKPNLYEKSGRLSLVAQQMKPVGLGDLLARIEQLKQRLAAEGLFREDRKKPLPVLPLRIGLITGRNSDAKKDILRNTHARWAAAEFEIREVATQGPGAPQEVAAALAELDADPAVEVIVIARGGGALEEVVLPFSDERLIRAVAAADTPVVSAIGHEADRPLLDEVADMRASTPTGAAKLLVVDEAQERDQLAHTRDRMSAGVERLIARETEWLVTLRSRPVLAQPQDMITGRAQELLMLRRRSLFGMETAVRRGTDWVAQTRARVRSLSPQSTLDRGYAVVQTHGAAGWDVLRDAGTVTAGDRLSIMVASGELTARAEEIYPEDRKAARAAHAADTAQTEQTQNREAAQ